MYQIEIDTTPLPPIECANFKEALCEATWALVHRMLAPGTVVCITKDHKPLMRWKLHKDRMHATMTIV